MGAPLRRRPVGAAGDGKTGAFADRAGMTGRARVLRWFPAATLVLMFAPVLAGLAGTVVPAFGWLPALGGARLSLAPWHDLMAAPGLADSVRLSFVTGLATTAFSLAIVVAFTSAWHGTPGFARAQRLLSPLLSVPHVTVAFGLAFLVMPSGWLVRLVSPWLTGWDRPPDFIAVHDPAGLALIAGLVVKEVPFLFLMTLAALGQSDAERARIMARTLGYGAMAAWLKAVFPRVYPQIRLPVYVVIAYSATVVDVAIVLGPTTPPPLAVQLLRWFNDPDLALRFMASAGAVLQIAVVAAAIVLWWLGERLVLCLGRIWVRGGHRGVRDGAVRVASACAMALAFAGAIAGLATMALWAFAGSWRFPDALPAGLSLDAWTGQGPRLAVSLANTAGLGALAALVGLVLVVGCLENEARRGRRPGTRTLTVLYAPLLVPQVAFLFGVQILLVVLGFDGMWLAVAWTHLVIVLPIVFLSLADPWRAWDERYARTAACLGASPPRILWRVKLPMLLRPVLVAFAVGFAVSVGLYLPTLIAGGGRVPTLTTEAVALAAGADRRAIGAYALLQMGLPLIAFALAAVAPAVAFRNRRALRVDA